MNGSKLSTYEWLGIVALVVGGTFSVFVYANTTFVAKDQGSIIRGMLLDRLDKIEAKIDHLSDQIARSK